MKTARTKLALSKELGLSRPTLDRYLVMPNAPTIGRKGWDVEAVRTFVGEQASTEGTAVKTMTHLQTLKAGEISLKSQKLQMELDLQMGKYVSVEEVTQVLVSAFEAIKMDIEVIPQLAPQLAGLSIVEISRRLAEGCREVLTHLSDVKWVRHLPLFKTQPGSHSDLPPANRFGNGANGT